MSVDSLIFAIEGLLAVASSYLATVTQRISGPKSAASWRIAASADLDEAVPFIWKETKEEPGQEEKGLLFQSTETLS